MIQDICEKLGLYLGIKFRLKSTVEKKTWGHLKMKKTQTKQTKITVTPCF